MTETSEKLRKLESLVVDSIEGKEVAEFKPLIYYDEGLDCVRVVVRDCSVVERRVNTFLTIYEDNYPVPNEEPYVGFSLKGVKHFLVEHELPIKTTVPVVELLDQMIKAFPEDVVELIINSIAKPILSKTESPSVELVAQAA